MIWRKALNWDDVQAELEQAEFDGELTPEERTELEEELVDGFSLDDEDDPGYVYG